MAQQIATVKKYRISLSEKELKVLRDRLVPICPMDYSLEDFAILRDLYGRLAGGDRDGHGLLPCRASRPIEGARDPRFRRRHRRSAGAGPWRHGRVRRRIHRWRAVGTPARAEGLARSHALRGCRCARRHRGHERPGRAGVRLTPARRDDQRRERCMVTAECLLPHLSPMVGCQ